MIPPRTQIRMTRTTLCAVTAATLASVSLLLMLVRTFVLGDEIKGLAGAECWKETRQADEASSTEAH